MSETLLSLFADWGIFALVGILFLGSIGVPLPTSLTVLFAGSVAAQGEISPIQAALAALAAVVLGDQIGYAIGRFGGRRLIDRITAKVGGASKVAAAEAFARRWSGAGVFLSRWLVGALGPWVNLASGVSGYPWSHFVLWGVLGEILWVALYGGLGFLFSDRIQSVAQLLGNASWAIAGIALTLFLAYRLFRMIRRPDTDADSRVTSPQ